MKKLLLFPIIFYSLTIAQEDNRSILSGSLLNDTKYVLSSLSDTSSFNIKISENKKTPILAALFSFAVPGTGQIYNEDYLKAGIFMAAEAAALIFAIQYENKGDDQTEFFENYANQNWSAARYARWTLNNLEFLNQNTGNNLSADDYQVFYANGSVNWNELNRLEDAIGSYYSHKLAPFGDQQYYEMIGKYSQFNVGWNEFGDENTPYDWYNHDPVVEQFNYYSKQRGKANDYYNISKWAVITVVSNHIISAIDAAWSASRFNKKLNFNISLEEENLGYYKNYYPKFNFSYNF